MKVRTHGRLCDSPGPSRGDHARPGRRSVHADRAL